MNLEVKYYRRIIDSMQTGTRIWETRQTRSTLEINIVTSNPS